MMDDLSDRMSVPDRPDRTDGAPLHLPSLSIDGFRGIDHLEFSRLGRVTLLAGRNGVGKTTVLDAIQIFADRGHVSTLTAMLERSEEVAQQREDVNDTDNLDFEALFYGRAPSFGSAFSVGSNGDSRSRLCVEVMAVDEQLVERISKLHQAMTIPDSPVLRVSFGEYEDYWPVFSAEFSTRSPLFRKGSRVRRGFSGDNSAEPVNCHLLGPGLLRNEELDALWGAIALTPSEPLALSALGLATNLGIEGVAIVPGAGRYYRRRVVVKLATGQRVPLRSLGDGAARLFGVAVTLVNAADGFLLIDEAENGIHHDLQTEFWRLVLRASQEHNVQVVATTHSWDCIVGFSAAASENESAEGVVVRLERDGDGLRAVEYSEEELEVAAAHGIEVR